jgi:hypothetical protein
MTKLYAPATATLAVAGLICAAPAAAAAPMVTSLFPASGPPNTAVVITGTGFSGIVINVKFGDTVTSFTTNSPTGITAIAPAGSSTVNVTVTTGEGTSNALPYTYGTTPPPNNPPPGKVDVGPGTSITSDGGPPAGSFCTIAAVGRDDLGRLVALTAGHCTTRPSEHQEVYLSGTAAVAPRLIGTYETITTNWPGFPSTQFPVDSSKDYAVILLDETVVNPKNTAPDGTTFDRLYTIAPAPMQDIMCKYGQITGLTCGLVFQFENNTIRSWAAILPGDSGGGVVINGGFAGINSAINPLTVLPPGAPFQFSGIVGILEDIASQGPNTVGIGFEPLP